MNLHSWLFCAAGIDYAFLEALPEELRAEVLEMHGAQVEAEAPPPAAAAPPQRPAAAAPAAATASSAPAAAGASGSAARPAAAVGPAAAAAGGSSGDAGLEGLDPDFLAALPPDIRLEVLAQQVRMQLYVCLDATIVHTCSVSHNYKFAA